MRSLFECDSISCSVVIWLRTNAYHMDLRWRMVCQRMALNKSFAEIASNLCIDQATVKRIVDSFENTGDVRKQPYPKHRVQRKLTPTTELILLTIVVPTKRIWN